MKETESIVRELNKLSLALIGIMTTMVMFAYETWTDPETEIQWKYEKDDGFAVLYGDYVEGLTTVSRRNNGSVTIPADLDGCPVVEIMPDAFCGCQGITEFQVHTDNVCFVAIDGVLYDDEVRTLIRCPQKKTEVVVPDGVRKIAEGAFAGCTELSSVVLPNSLEQIERNAFWNCPSLKKIVIPASVTVMDSGCLSGCPNLGDVYFEGDAPDVRVVEVYRMGKRDEYGRNLYYAKMCTVVTDGDGNTSTSCEILSKCVDEEYCSQTTMTSDDGAVTLVTTTASQYFETVPYYSYRYDSNLNYDLSKCPDGTGIVTNCHPWAIYDLMDGWECPRTSPGLVTHAKKSTKGWNWGDSSVDPIYWCGRNLKLYDGDSSSVGEKEIVGNQITLVSTNIVVHYIVNSVQPVKAIPATMDTGFVNIVTEVLSGGVVSVPETWSQNYPSFFEKYGSDFAKALTKKTGKIDGSGNAMLVWQDYVAGTDPTDACDVFTASVTVVGGKPVVSYSPELSETEKAKRLYTTYGKKTLMDTEWVVVPSGSEVDYNFFKVTVEMR